MLFDRIVRKEMIKMNRSLRFISFIFTCVISTINSQDSTKNVVANSSKGPGISSCYYYGDLETFCGLSIVPIASIPEECSSYFLEGIVVNLAHDLYYIGSERDERFLDDLLKCGKPVYLRFGHLALGEWTQIFGCDSCSEINACDEMEGVIAYLNKHQGITGLVLMGLIPDEDATYFPNLSESLRTYISVMKSTFPNLQIAISIPGWFIVDYYKKLDIEWLDFTVLDPVVDFYEICFGHLEECTAKLRNKGSTPLSGNFTYTLEKIAKYIPKTKIVQEKIYFRVELYPTSPDYSVSTCQTSNEEMCVDPKFSKDWCSDTLMTYYEKGVYARKLGNGFIGANVDYDDPYGCCKCKPFPSFHAVLNGFNCADPPPPCPAIDRP